MTTSESVRDAFHYLFRDELPALKQLARDLPPDPLVVNIGAGAGTSGLAFLESRFDLLLVTVDIQDESSPFGCLQGERVVVEDAGLGALWGESWFQICQDSVLLGHNWLTGSMTTAALSPAIAQRALDMVFIDGDHSYAGCKGDIQAWMRNLKPGGILAVHDYNKQLLAPTRDGPHPKEWTGVNRAVDELLLHSGYETILYVDSLIAFRIGNAA